MRVSDLGQRNTDELFRALVHPFIIQGEFRPYITLTLDIGYWISFEVLKRFRYDHTEAKYHKFTLCFSSFSATAALNLVDRTNQLNSSYK